jgi:cell division protein FtsW (lipid II flippase)
MEDTLKELTRRDKVLYGSATIVVTIIVTILFASVGTPWWAAAGLGLCVAAAICVGLAVVTGDLERLGKWLNRRSGE